MSHSKWRTNYRLWAFSTGCAFTVLACFDLTFGIAEKPTDFWSVCQHVLNSNPNSMERGIGLMIVIAYAGIIGILAALVGWSVQATWQLIKSKSYVSLPTPSANHAERL